ncbi:MAG TPA: carbohydrate ABC transporter permease [Candidatus Eremiobacteraceae bacterium]|nr:carbohydrate ABC transporter permease [Candidatus Eremiobacteraceae bacterium]
MSNTKRRLARFTGAAVLVGWAVLSLFPLYWMFLTAFSPQADTTTFPPHWLPQHLTFENFRWLFAHVAMGRWFVNSLLVASAVTCGSLLLNTMAGYAFAKLRFPGREQVFWLLLGLMMVPEIVTLIPLYIVANDLWLSDTYFILIAPFLASVWGIFLIKQFLQTLPSALLDAARVDGASEWTIFWKIVLPLARPVLGALAIFTFVGQWNSLLWWLFSRARPRCATSRSALRASGSNMRPSTVRSWQAHCWQPFRSLWSSSRSSVSSCAASPSVR